MVDNFLIILSPPRSFSSVVSTMIGQHPQLYGFPELHLFIGDTVQEVIDREYERGNYFGPPGVLRTVAQLVYGRQTSATIAKATGWLLDHKHWSTKRLVNYFRELVEPLIAVEKSPVTCLRPLWIERAYAYFPNAYYLHLTRHPVSTRRSMNEFYANKAAFMKKYDPTEHNDRLLDWYRFHKNIMDFTSTLPLGQAMRVKGEDVLSEPEVYLAQIADWLGIRTDKAAVTAMMHPEFSPYAYRGPEPARGGNDPKFMRDPCLRKKKIKEPSLSGFVSQEKLCWVPEKYRTYVAEAGYRLVSDKEFIEEVTGLSHCMGYR